MADVRPFHAPKRGLGAPGRAYLRHSPSGLAYAQVGMDHAGTSHAWLDAPYKEKRNFW